ncbi:MAG: OmpA family protein [Pseudomonadales bacterium]
MKINHVIAITALSLVGNQTMAAEPDTGIEEKRGAIIGTVIGAAAGGPFGAGVGAIIGGGVVGKLVGLQREYGELNDEMADVQSQYRRAKVDMKTEIAHLRNALNQAERDITAMASAPKVPLQFRTDSSRLEAHYRDHLKEVARLLAKRPEVQVRLSGFADPRGSEEYNQRLSEARVAEVKEYLINHGVSARQIAGKAFGESRPLSAEGAREDYFFDRRVVMEFSGGDRMAAEKFSVMVE